jgi:DnaJ-class molecular chaperone
VTNPFATLGLLDTASTAEVKVRWRELAFRHHPDQGGDPAVFDEMRKAYNSAMQVAENRPCPACNGKGYILRPGDFGSLREVCKECS